MSCRIVILISGSGSNLQAFIDAVSRNELSAAIVGVISNRPGAGGLERARNAGLSTRVVDHTGFDTRDAFDQALQQAIDAYQPELVILAGFMRILGADFVRHFQGRLLNIHPSLLPKYPGLHTHRRAIEAGDKEGGATVHFVTEELDGGPPIVHACVPILPGDTEELLAARVLVEEHKIYPLAANWFAEGRLKLTGNKAELDDQILPASGLAYTAS